MEKDDNEKKVVVETVTANKSDYTPKNNMALAGFICSISGFITCGIVSIVGLILSIIGLNKSKELNGEGKGLAIAGIVIGVIETISIVVIAFFMVFFFSIAIPDIIESVEPADDVEEEYSCVVSFRDSNDNLLMDSSVLKYDGASITKNANGEDAIRLSIKNKDRLFDVTSRLSKQSNNQLVVWTDFDREYDSYETEAEYCGTINSDCIGVVYVNKGITDDIIISGDYDRDDLQEIVDCINN